MGAWAATAFAVYVDIGLPQWAVFPFCFLVAFLAGAIWGIIAVLPKSLWKVNEIIITLMMNYIALLVAGLLVLRCLARPGSCKPAFL